LAPYLFPQLPLSPSFIPLSVQHLDFSRVELTPSSMNSLTFSSFVCLFSLVLPFNFDRIFKPNEFPLLKFLRFGPRFNSPLDNLPINLESLEFPSDSHFNQLLPLFPSSLTSLTFGQFFNRPLNQISSACKLTQLKFGQYFNERITPGTLPTQLSSLEFNKEYSHSEVTREHFPLQLQHLTLYSEFSQTLDNLLPITLKSLRFPSLCNFRFPLLSSALPPNLQLLEFSADFDTQLNENSLPQSLETLTNLCSLPAIGVLPASLTSLSFSCRFTARIGLDWSFPPNLRIIRFFGFQHFPLFPNLLPSALERLEFHSSFYPIPPRHLPRKLNGRFDCYYEDTVKHFKSPKTTIKGEATLVYPEMANELGVRPNAIFNVICRTPWNPLVYEVELKDSVGSPIPLRFFVLYIHIERVKKS
jgi:hypothetical protein